MVDSQGAFHVEWESGLAGDCHGSTEEEVLLSCEGITMMQATESGKRLNPASVSRVPRDRAPLGRVLGEPQMGSVLVVVADIFVHESLQMPFIEHDHMVQQVAAAASYPTLGHSVLPRTAKCGANRLSPQVLDRGDHVIPEFCIPIEKGGTSGPGHTAMLRAFVARSRGSWDSA